MEVEPRQIPTEDGQSWPRLSFHKDDLPCTGMGFWLRVVGGLQNLRWRWSVASYKRRSASRSFRGHMRLLSPKGKPVLLMGPAYTAPVEPSDLVELHARTASIESLSATYPWIDLVDRQIFLMGFRAGLEQASHNPNIQIAKS
jgi:hypothetical protein